MDARDKKNIELLARLAETVEPVRKARLAASIVISNDVVSFGINQLKSHPLQSRFGKNEDSIYLHAEIDAIKNALRHINVEDLEKATLYITRVKFDSWEKRNLIYGLAKPCSGCQRAILTFGISRVVYTLDGTSIEQM